MKFLKFNEDDELFNVDLNLFTQFKNKLDETEKDIFLMMYGTQGRTFWLQFILTFRYNYYRDHFITEIKPYKSLCVFAIIEVVESIFINIHKRYLEDGCDPLRLLETIAKYVYLSAKFISRIVNEYKAKRSRAYDVESKDVEFIKDLIGDFKSYDKTLIAKCVVASQCYARFFMCIYNLLQKYKSAEEVSKSFLKNNPSKQYWQPFSIWNNENFMPSFFEKYLVSHYNKKLQNMLSLSPATLKIFESRQIDHFCSVSENIEPAESEVNDDRLVYRRKHCTTHTDCWEKIIHDKGCQNPYNCSSCLLICDTVLQQKINKMGEEAFWWNCCVSFHPSIVKGHKDVMIQTDTLITSTEKYICVDSAKAHFYVRKKIKKSLDSSRSVLCLPAEMQSEYNQLKREFIVKCRMREKFDKKEEANDNFITREQVNPLFSKATKCVNDKAALNSEMEYSKNYAYLFFIIPFLQTNISPVFLRNLPVMSGHKRDAGVCCDALTHQQALKANASVKSRARCNSVFSYVYEGYKKFFPKEKYMKDENCSNSKSTSENKIICKKKTCTITDEKSLNSATNIDHNGDLQVATSETIYSPFTPNEIIATLKLIKSLESDDNAVCMDLPSEQTSENDVFNMSENSMEDTMENQKIEEFFSLLKSNCKDKEIQSVNAEEENARSAALLDPALHERLCSYCGMIEVQKKSFKKCAQCKKENFQPMHYYCSKECQKEDWMESHKKDHFPN